MHTDPRTKEQLLNRLLSYDFDGDLANIGESRAAITRTAANRVDIRFPTTGQHFALIVRKPRVKPLHKPRRAARVTVETAAPAMPVKVPRDRRRAPRVTAETPVMAKRAVGRARAKR